MQDKSAEAKAWYEAAQAHCEAERFDDAVEAARMASAVNPREPKYLYLLGTLFLRKGQWAQASDSLRAVVRLLPGFKPAHSQLAAALARQGELTEAIASLRNALALGYEDAMTHYNLAAFLLTQGQNTEADFHFREAVRIQPDLTPALYNLGTLELRQGRRAEALAHLEQAHRLRPDNADILRNLAFARRTCGDAACAVPLYEQLVASEPTHFLNHYDLGVTLLSAGRIGESIAALRHALRLEPGHLPVYSNLTEALFKAGCYEEAREVGLRALRKKDAVACARVGPSVCAAPTDRGGRDVIAFSLWGADPTYTIGAIQNVQMARRIYPQWTCRFYVDTTVPSSVIEELDRSGAEIQIMERRTQNEALFWRFRIANDDTVRRFLVRDCDSRPSERERAAVDEWLGSGQPFHIMRDHIIHTELILAGLWGGTAGVLPDIEPLARPYYEHPHERWSDQLFLAEAIWPRIKARCCIHDSCYKLFGARSFPTGDDAPDGERLGMGHKLSAPSPEVSPAGAG